MKRHIFVLAIILLCVTAHQAIASTITADEKTLSILDEVATSSNSMLTQSFGLAVGNILVSNGSFTETGWSLNLGGNYAGLPVALNFIGSFNPTSDTGFFNSVGTIGSASWLSSGSWSFADVSNDVNSVTEEFSSEATITPVSGNPIKPDRKAINKKETRNPDGSISDTGQWMVTENGNDTGKRIPFTSFIMRTAGISTVTSSDSVLVGAVNFTAGTTSGSVTTVPEPGSLLLIALGGFSVFAVRRRSYLNRYFPWLRLTGRAPWALDEYSAAWPKGELVSPRKNGWLKTRRLGQRPRKGEEMDHPHRQFRFRDAAFLFWGAVMFCASFQVGQRPAFATIRGPDTFTANACAPLNPIALCDNHIVLNTPPAVARQENAFEGDGAGAASSSATIGGLAASVTTTGAFQAGAGTSWDNFAVVTGPLPLGSDVPVTVSMLINANSILVGQAEGSLFARLFIDFDEVFEFSGSSGTTFVRTRILQVGNGIDVAGQLSVFACPSPKPRPPGNSLISRL
jgi:PEP-CTERM motif-containing protein